MARVCKSLKPESGYPHRDHRAKKSRDWKPKVHLKKRRVFKEKIRQRKEAELYREEESILQKYKIKL